MNERSTWTVPSGLPLAPKLLREISFPWRGEAMLLKVDGHVYCQADLKVAAHKAGTFLRLAQSHSMDIKTDPFSAQAIS